MRIATVTLKSVSPYSQSKVFSSPKTPKEKDEDHEERCWKERAHLDSNGRVIIPGMAFKIALESAARFRGEKIKGKGNATYSKRFVSGILVTDDIVTPYTLDKMVCERLFVPSDGMRGGGKRVWKKFPVFPSWSGTLDFHVLDSEVITPDKFEEHLREAGAFIGIGRWRAERGGLYGRFEVVKIQWSK